MELINNNREVIVKSYNKKIRKIGYVPPANPFNPIVSKSANVTPAILSWIQENMPKSLPAENLIINPILLRNYCHMNVDIMLTFLNQNTVRYEHVIGYNVTACPCGSLWYLELHSVLRHIPTQELIDLTTDMYGETQKWFIPMKPHQFVDMPFVKQVRALKLDAYYNTHLQHTCRRQEWGMPIEAYRGDDIAQVNECWALEDIHSVLYFK
jgi:hypothetical protein